MVLFTPNPKASEEFFISIAKWAPFFKGLSFMLKKIKMFLTQFLKFVIRRLYDEL